MPIRLRLSGQIPIGEHTVEAARERVPATIAQREELWKRRKDDLMVRTKPLLEELARLGGRCAHVLDEAIDMRHDATMGQAWLRGRPRPLPGFSKQAVARSDSSGRLHLDTAEHRPYREILVEDAGRLNLLNNLLSHVPAIGIADDALDPELIQRPQRWNMPFIGRFMTEFGAVSSLFDFLTFAVLVLGFKAAPALFRTGWIVESLLTEA